jgi:hypothetical protein
MAKKVIATLQTQGKEFSKLIRMVRSPKTGAYVFKETMLPNDQVKSAIEKK